MNRPFVGLLPVDPHRVYVYWDMPLPARGRLGLVSVCGTQRVPEVAACGGHYFHSLESRRVYVFELRCDGQVVARSNTVELPPDAAAREEAPADPAPSSHCLP
jgi:hypothetical protein